MLLGLQSLLTSSADILWVRAALASVVSTCVIELPAPSRRQFPITIRSFKFDTSAMSKATFDHTDKGSGKWLCTMIQGDEYGFLADAAAVDTQSRTVGYIRGSGDVFVDVGANVGWWAVVMAKIYAAIGMRVIAVEPNRGTYRYLLWNIRENDVSNSVVAMNAGVVSTNPDEPKFLWMERCTPHEDSLSPCYSLAGRLRDKGALQHVLSDIVATISLPALLRRFNVSSVSALKVDCEGCEWPLLGGDSRGDSGWAAMSAYVRHVVGELHDFGSGGDVVAGNITMCGFIGARELQRFLRDSKLMERCWIPD